MSSMESSSSSSSQRQSDSNDEKLKHNRGSRGPTPSSNNSNIGIANGDNEIKDCNDDDNNIDGTQIRQQPLQQQLIMEDQVVLISPRSRRRTAATEQANAVLEVMGGVYSLDGFNLLGVIANPRAGGGATGTHTTATSTSSPSSVHGRYNPQGSSDDANNNTNTSYLQSLEQTISSVSESMGTFSTVLEDWSRSILEDDPGGGGVGVAGSTAGVSTTSSFLLNPFYAIMGATTSAPEEEDIIPESQLKELPEELENLNVQSVTTYLSRCGAEAASFQEILIDIDRINSRYKALSSTIDSEGGTHESNNNKAATEKQKYEVENHENSSSSLNGGPKGIQRKESMGSAGTNEDAVVDVSVIPSIFFDESFDLTNPETFCDVLLLDKGNNILGSCSNNISTSNTSIATSSNSNPRQQQQENTHDDVPVSDLFPVVHPDALNGYLDKIELALLQQVRANSGQFFAESQRFAGLHEDIHILLATVKEQKSINSILQKDMVQTAEIIPICDLQREQLRQLWDVLDKADNLLQCKTGLAGILSAQDDLTAIEQIQYGRKLLYTTSQGKESKVSGVENKAFKSSEIQLGHLRAFKSISEQFDQYEELVVNNLRDELIEIFLAWNDHAISTVHIGSSCTSSGPSTNNGLPTAPPIALKENVRNRVKEINGALRTCQALAKAREAYQSRLHDVIRMTVRTTVGEFASDVTGPTPATISTGATAMSLTRFLDCLDMLFEQLLALISSAAGVDAFYIAEDLTFQDDKNLDNKNGTSDDTKKKAEPSSSISEDTSNESIISDLSIKRNTPLASVVITAAELSSKSISELLRLRKEAHSLVSLEEMKTIWDVCINFARQIENLCTTGTTSSPTSTTSMNNANPNNAHTALLRSTLLTQTKAFVERKHESHMSALVAALDSERWVQCDVSFERQLALTRLCSGRAIIVSSKSQYSSNSNLNGDAFSDAGASTQQQKLPEIEAEGVRYKVVWSCLLLVEMILTNIATSAHFPSLSATSVSKVSELLRLFNSRTTHLVLGAGAIHSTARLKSINAKHLSLVTQCLGLMMAILPHVRAALAAQMPKKQHTLLTGLDQIKKEYADHNEKILNKFVSIIGGIVEHALAKQIYGTDFDGRANEANTTSESPASTMVSCCVFLEGVSSNAKKMHQVLCTLLPPDHLKDVFSRIYAYIDGKVPVLFIAAAEASESIQTATARKENDLNAGKSPQRPQQPQRRPTFSFPSTIEGKRQFLLEIDSTTKSLNSLEGIHPWDFTARNVLERRLEYSLEENTVIHDRDDASKIDMSVPKKDETSEQESAEEPNACRNGDIVESPSLHRVDSKEDDDEVMSEFQSASTAEDMSSPPVLDSTEETRKPAKENCNILPSLEQEDPSGAGDSSQLSPDTSLTVKETAGSLSKANETAPALEIENKDEKNNHK